MRDELVSSLDVVPTILDSGRCGCATRLAGPIPLAVCSAKGEKPWRQFLFTEYHGHYPPIYFPQRTVRDERYKLIVNLLTRPTKPRGDVLQPDGSAPSSAVCDDHGVSRRQKQAVRQAYETWYDAPPVELYDLKTDPYEWQNRADDPALENGQGTPAGRASPLATTNRRSARRSRKTQAAHRRTRRSGNAICP